MDRRRWLCLLLVMVYIIIMMMMLVVVAVVVLWLLMVIMMMILVVLVHVVGLRLTQGLHVVVNHWDTGQSRLAIVGIPTEREERANVNTKVKVSQETVHLRWC